MQHIPSLKTILFSTLALLLIWSACQRQQFTDDPADTIGFSTDTLRFDTVFTQLGSATRILKIYNPHKQSIRVSKIYLEQGAQSRFRINVDGLSGSVHENLDIAPNDSLYIFVAVTINPDLPVSASPFVIDENLVFETNGNEARVVLEAWGQNANYIPSRFSADSLTVFGCDGGEWVWDDPKPYVIYGIVAITDCTVRIPAGTKVYVHGGLTRFVENGEIGYYNDGFLAFADRGRLIVEGTKDKPVVFQGDRLESEFAETPGQWTGLWLQTGTTGHRLEHCIIKNSIVGVRVDSAAELTLKNTQILNTAGSGLIGIHATINAENCLFRDNTGFCIQLEYGGDYRFDYCTAASYGVDGEALRISNTLCYDPLCSQFDVYRLNALFRNCVLMGSRDDQFTLFAADEAPALFNYRFENSLVRVKDLTKPNGWPNFFERCVPCLNVTGRDTVFVDPNRDIYLLDTLHSPARAYAQPLPAILRDLLEQERDPVMPDAGCYELRL
jgi:Right handed beta helix region